MKIIRTLILAISMTSLVSCGGGGSSVTTAVTSGATTQVTGVVAAGIIYPGTTNIYRLLTDGSRGGLLASAQIKPDGSYLADIGSYIGPILIEASGEYTDEVTQQIRRIEAYAPLHAVVANASGNTTASVTPLTELAYLKAGTLTVPAIEAANSLVTNLFKIDILGAKPVKFELGSLNLAPNQPSKDYTLALAALSQMTVGHDLAYVINAFRNDISGGVMSAAMAQSFTTALASVMSTTQIASTTTQLLWGVGSKKVRYRLVLSGSATLIGGLNTTITVPSGISAMTNQDTSLLDGYVTPTGTATGVKFFFATFTPAVSGPPATPGAIVIAMANTPGFNTGEVAQLTLDLAAGFSDPAPSAFTIKEFTPVDMTGTAILGLTAQLQAF